MESNLIQKFRIDGTMYMSFTWAGLMFFFQYLWQQLKTKSYFPTCCISTIWQRKYNSQETPLRGWKKKIGFVFFFLCELQETNLCPDTQRYLST